ncbi:4Fe-4S binding protein [Adlercreutzia equolifaciens]|uniref:4Fe-4S binding protein n=1 Tax=Adlercreutzia equolifaciens TaxID=446660 RepID=UPI003D18E8AD
MAPPVLLMLACMVLVIALVGRLFCSWICPVPPLSRFFHPKEKRGGSADSESRDAPRDSALPESVEFANDASPIAAMAPLSAEEKQWLAASCRGSSRPLKPVGGARDGVQIDSRHFVLAGAVASSAVFGFPIFCLVCPIGLVFGTLVALWIAFVDHNPTWMLLVFPLVLVLELVVFRKWCHVLCPLGALMSLVGAKAPLGKPRVATEKCLRSKGIDCQVCTHVCPEALDPHGKALSECTRCGLCAEHCPGEAISLAPWARARSKRAACERSGKRVPSISGGNLCDDGEVKYDCK